jgi:hypothetical protein
MAAKSLGIEGEVDPTLEFVRDEVANYFHSISTCFGSLNSGTAGFLPFDGNPGIRIPFQCVVPVDGDLSIVDRERTVLCRIGRQLVQHH